MKYILIALPYVVAVVIAILRVRHVYNAGKVESPIAATLGQFVAWVCAGHIVSGLLLKSITPGEVFVTVVIAVIGGMIYAFIGLRRNSEANHSEGA